MSRFGHLIHPYVEAELAAADVCAATQDFASAFRHLERAHVLGQSSTREHVRVHWRMLLFALRRRKAREIAGQLFRIAGAAALTAFGLVPHGNTGGSNVSPFRRMPIPSDLASAIAEASKAPASHLLAAFIFAGLALAAAERAHAALPDDARTIVVDGHRLAFRIVGSGRPAIIMLSGLGDGMATFEDVARELGKTATVIIYDRAGYGGSEPGSEPRDAAAAASELSGLLAQSGVAPPYVLSGHSLGGLFAEYYAAKHPEQISGLILEDSRPADFTRRCVAARAGWCIPPKWLVWFMPKGARGEAAALANVMVQVEGSVPLSGKPVLILSRPAVATGTPSFDVLWTQAQADLAARYPGSEHLSAAAGGHYVHYDQRDWFLSSVRTFLTRVR